MRLTIPRNKLEKPPRMPGRTRRVSRSRAGVRHLAVRRCRHRGAAQGALDVVGASAQGAPAGDAATSRLLHGVREGRPSKADRRQRWSLALSWRSSSQVLRAPQRINPRRASQRGGSHPYVPARRVESSHGASDNRGSDKIGGHRGITCHSLGSNATNRPRRPPRISRTGQLPGSGRPAPGQPDARRGYLICQMGGQLNPPSPVVALTGTTRSPSDHAHQDAAPRSDFDSPLSHAEAMSCGSGNRHGGHAGASSVPATHHAGAHPRTSAQQRHDRASHVCERFRPPARW